MLLEIPVLFLASLRACSLCRHWFLSALPLVLLMPLGSQSTADSPKYGCFHYGWVVLPESSSPPRPWLHAGFITWVSLHGDNSRKHQVSAGKISQHPGEVTFPASPFQAAPAVLLFISLYKKNPAPYMICNVFPCWVILLLFCSDF